MVNYADIQRIYRNEKAFPELQKIEDGFYEGAKKLLAGIGDEHKEYLEKLVSEVFERRKVKIVLAAMRSPGKEPSNMAQIEKELYCSITKTFEDYRNSVFCLDGGSLKEKEGEPPMRYEKARLRFVKALPAIIGLDLVHYGPFKEGDVAEIPVENAKILVEKDIAEEA